MCYNYNGDNMNKTKIIATIGPASKSKEKIRDMYYNGMNVVRLNLSHASHSFCETIIKEVNALNQELDTHIAIMLDLTGPDIRVGHFKDEELYLEKGTKLKIYDHDVMGSLDGFSTNYDALVKEVKCNSLIRINDGKVDLKVIDKDLDNLTCEVITPGLIANEKNLHVPGTHFERPFLSNKDIEDIKFAVKMQVDFLALSFLSSHEDILDVSDQLIALKDDHISLVAKIENESAIDDIDEIIRVSDGIMVARGDLGVEIPIERVPGIQKMIINKCNEAGKVCIVATEMLSSMEQVIRPTRAEVSDVANAVLDGCDAIMLSGETTTGNYPVETVDMMSRIAASAEHDINYNASLERCLKTDNRDVASDICYSVAASAYRLGSKAIAVPTLSGDTARKLSRFRPSAVIVALSPNEEVLKSLALNFGVYGIKIKELNSFDKIMEEATNKLHDLMLLNPKDTIIITGGYPFEKVKTTNFMKIEEI